MLLYRTLRAFFRSALRVFFRRIEVVDPHLVPLDGPVIFAGNHPNSLLDPVVIITTCGRRVRFAAKDVLFRSRLLRPLLDAMGAVPVRRRSDHGGGPVDNETTFEQLFAVLRAGEAMGIFPEGISHDAAHLTELKTGAARIAFGAAAGLPPESPPLSLVPCGLHYVNRKRFRSSVLVQYGEPLRLDAERVAAWRADEKAAVRALTDELTLRMRALTVNADDWDTVRVLDGVRRLYQPPRIPLEARVELARRFNAVYPTVRDRPDVAALYARVQDWLERLEDVGLTDDELTRPLRAGRALLAMARQLTMLLVWLPLAIVGAPLHLPILLGVSVGGPRIAPRKDVIGTTKFMAGLWGVVALYAATAALAGWWWGWPWTVVALFALPASGYGTLRVLERGRSLRRLTGALARVLRLGAEVEALRAERGALQKDVIDAVGRHIPPEMVPLFPRAEAGDA